MVELVYHYTTIEAFFEMIKKIKWDQIADDHFLTFWASSIYAMNDPQEFMHGYKILQDSLLPEIERELNIKDNKLKLSNIAKIWGYKDLDKWNKDIIDMIYTAHDVPFVVSFSRNKDYLPMWKEYTNEGKGVCLCFNNYEYTIKNLENVDVDIDITHRLHAMDVSYDHADDSIRNALYSIYRRHYSDYCRDNQEIRKQKMLSCFATMAVTVSPYFKHNAYKYENEVRLIEFKKDNNDVNYRFSKHGRLIPYIEVPVKLQYLNQIIIGPCADSHSIIRELRTLLSRYKGNEKDFIIPSAISYREY